MTASAYATIADLKAASGDDTIAPDDARALRLIEFASAKIDEYCGQTFPTTEGDDVPLIITSVCAAVAARGWLNPAGAQSTSETTGPFGETTTFGAPMATSSVPMALRASEKDDLSNYKIRRSGISTISTYRPVPIPEVRYLETSDGGKPFPWPDPDYL
jgi:phage gp36-like protein